MTQPPRAKKIPYEILAHGEARVDDWFWLRHKENPEVTRILNEENAYLEDVLQPHQSARESLFQELKGRLKEDDQGVPVKIDDYYYYSRVVAGKQYAIHCRKKHSLDAPEEIVLDGNVLAEGKNYFRLGVFEVSPSHKWLAYSVDFDGSEKFTVQFKNLETGELSPESITGTSPSLEWAEDDRTVFYVMLDKHERPDRVLRHRLGTPSDQDQLIYREEDSRLFVSVTKTKSRRYLFIQMHGKVTSEYLYLEADRPMAEFRVFSPRRHNVLYDVDHHGDLFYILTNDEEKNFRLVTAPLTKTSAENWKELRRGGPALYLEGIDLTQDHLVVFERTRGLQQVRVTRFSSGDEHSISFEEPTYSITPTGNAEFNTKTLRFSFSSLVTPATVFDYDLVARTREVKKVQEIPGGYDPTQYRSERIEATAPDGTKVPLSIVYKKGFEPNPKSNVYLYGYGSYGYAIPPAFSTHRLSLLDRGFVYALAHIRGGEDLGRAWYDDGKFLKKKNTFLDFVACAEHLIQARYTSKGQIVIVGGSAGGMLVGAVMNLRPDLFRGVVAHVPFVDVLNTMEDATLPLTVTEFEEWGNPQDKIYYDYIKSYSPYDNVERKAYPHLLVTAGLNDPRVTYWEPMKWVQKLRDMKTDSNWLLMHTHMGAGHGGASGRYDALKDIALEYVFILKIFDLLPR
ncbi:MAG: S9 family peptidase [Bdellovibrionaceae bacterium]|nr:S9 family peptidase [Pseudobdellovibrionaceae bacterium]